MLIVRPAGVALAYVWIALGQKESLRLGVSVPMALLGLFFAVFVAPLTASALSSVDESDEGLTSGINNAASPDSVTRRRGSGHECRVFRCGHEIGLVVVAATSIGGALTAPMTLGRARPTQTDQKRLSNQAMNPGVSRARYAQEIAASYISRPSPDYRRIRLDIHVIN